MGKTIRNSSIARVVKKISLYEKKTDAAYWRAQPPLARLAVLEQIRQEYILWKYHTEPRLQRVYQIVKRQ